MPDPLKQSVFRKVKPKKMGEEMAMPKEMRPSVHFGFDVLPEAKKWEVGKTYKVALEIKQTDMSMHDENKGHAGFEIMGIKVL